MGLSAGLTALIGLNGTVAALLPMAVVMAMRRSFPPSQLLMPLAFAGSAGGMLLLTGSPVNVVISEAAADAVYGEFGFLEFAWVGLPLVAGTMLIVLFFGARLLPTRLSSTLPPDLSRHAQTLVEHYSLDNVFHFRDDEGSPLLGSPSSAIPRSRNATPATWASGRRPIAPHATSSVRCSRARTEPRKLSSRRGRDSSARSCVPAT